MRDWNKYEMIHDQKICSTIITNFPVIAVPADALALWDARIMYGADRAQGGRWGGGAGY